jgi:hypothetical protein
MSSKLHKVRCHHFEWLLTGFGLVTWFIDSFTTQLGTTSDYSDTAKLHTLQFTVLQPVLPSLVVSW